MPAQEQLFWCLTLEHLIQGIPNHAAAAAIFGRMAGNQALKASSAALSLWLKTVWRPWAIQRLQRKTPHRCDLLMQKLDVALKHMTPRNLLIAEAEVS